jgi:iron complex outermembrane receptor protein
MKSILQSFLLLILLGTTAHAQQTLKGVIKDDKSEPLVGATVNVKGTSAFAITDIEGNFSIVVPEKFPITLSVQYVGFDPKEVVVKEFSNELIQIALSEVAQLSEVVITARRREETVQQVPIPIAVIRGGKIEEAGAFNVNRLKEFVPSVQLYSSNPRNTTLNIRGLGSTFGLTNDGLDPGVGFYVDGVYFSRPAATMLDFIDVERIEVLRGPQGTLFGKNTTAGAFNITTRKPTFTPTATFEASYGNYLFIQTKASVSGPIAKNVAGRISFSGTQRNGLIDNIRTNKKENSLNNLGVRGQLLIKPGDKVEILLSGDYTRQRPTGYAQIVAGVAPTLRAGYRQFDSIIADLGYSLPSKNAFDRVIDHDTPWNSESDIAGAAVNVDVKLGPGKLTSTTAFRFWDWGPSNDRDFTGLQSLAKSQNPSTHNNWSQEIRYSGQFTQKLSGVAGIFIIDQNFQTNGTEESGKDTWRFVQSSKSSLWKTPGLFEGYGIKTDAHLDAFSAAAFAQVDWEIFKGFHFLPGIRYNYDKKAADYKRTTYGGLITTDSALNALKSSVYSNQAFVSEIKKSNVSGQATLSYNSKYINSFVTYANNFKPVGVNLAGLPTDKGQVLTDLAVLKPETVHHVEVGVKTNPAKNFTLNLTLFNTSINDYQTQVQAAELGLNRGYLANAEKVRVRGIEVEANVAVKDFLTFYGSVSVTDGKYITFLNAPLPLEETGKTVDGKQVAFKDISGSDLPGISKVAGTFGAEVSKASSLFGYKGKFYLAIDSYFRTKFSSSPTPSAYLNVDGYGLLNARAGFKAVNGLSFNVWGRNLLNKDYYEFLLPAGGNAGQIGAVLGDQLTYGITLKYAFIK